MRPSNQIFFLGLFIVGMAFAFNANAWVTDTHVIRGKVRNFDEKKVEILLADGGLLSLDRAVVSNQVSLRPGHPVFIPLSFEQEKFVHILKKGRKPASAVKLRLTDRDLALPFSALPKF